MTRTALAACLALLLPSLAAAGPDRRDAWHEGRGVREDKAALRDDLRDAQQAEQLLRDFEQVVAARDGWGLNRVEMRVRVALDQEAAEANAEMASAAQELGDTDRKYWRERREVQRDWEEGRPGRFEHDRRDLGDDRRDRADDHRDLMREQEYRRRVLAVREEWTRLQGLRQPRWISRKHELLEELVRLSHYEIRKDEQELREDRQERRDDWRERQEQRREWDEDHRGWEQDRPQRE